MFDWLRTQYFYDEATYEEYYLTDISRLTDGISSFALYVTIALIAVLLTAYVVLRLKRPEALSGFYKLLVGIIVGYSVATIALLGYLNVIYYIIDGKINTNFYLVVGGLAFILLAILAGIIVNSISKKAFKVFLYVCLGVLLAYAVLLIALIPAKKPAYEPLNVYGMYIFSALLVVLAVALTLIFDRKNNLTQTTKTLSYAGVCVALSFALSYVKFFTIGATGGSVTFASLLPLMIFAYKFGAKKGMFAGVVYGFLQFIQSPQFYQPMQFLLDYPIAFGVIGLVGTARNFKCIKSTLVKFIIGAVIAVTFRYFSHVLSGYYVFSSWAWEGWGALAYSLVYNLYCFVDLAVLLVPAVAIFSSPAFNKQFIEND